MARSRRSPSSRGVEVDDVVVGSREHGLQHADELLVDPTDLRLVTINDREVPGPPVLRSDLTHMVAMGTDEVEADLAEDVLLHDVTHLAAVTVVDVDPGLHQLGGSRELQDLDVLGVVDRQPMRQILIDGRHEANDLPEGALALLLEVSEGRTVRSVDLVLVRQLDELRLLAHDERVGEKQRCHANSSPPPHAASTGSRYSSIGGRKPARSPVHITHRVRAPMRGRRRHGSSTASL
jgi:hypothetical protein